MSVILRETFFRVPIYSKQTDLTSFIDLEHERYGSLLSESRHDEKHCYANSYNRSKL